MALTPDQSLLAVRCRPRPECTVAELSEPEERALGLRPAHDHDVEQIRAWRNHPKVRGSSIWTAYITADGHADWWRRVEADPSKLVMVFEDEGHACGVVTYNDIDRVSRTAEWGFFLDIDTLEASGRLVGAWVALEQAAIAFAFDELGLDEIGGRTLARNTPVLALHRRFGFIEVPNRGYHIEIDGTEHAVVWTALTRDLRT